MARWETRTEELLNNLNLQVGHQIEAAIPGGGLLGKYNPKEFEKYLDETARMARKRTPSPITIEKAKEITEANRLAKE